MTARPPLPGKKPTEDARLGATLAFGNGASKPLVKPKPGTAEKPRVGERDNGALAAALSSAAGAERGKMLEAQSTGSKGRGKGNVVANRGSFDGGGNGALWKQNTGSSVGDTMGTGNGGANTMRPRFGQLSPGVGSTYLQPDQARSQSFIAATLAASRSASISPSHTGSKVIPSPTPADLRIPQKYGSRSPSVRSAESSRGSEEIVLDTRSIPPTGNLIGMFEQNAVVNLASPKAVKKSKTPSTVKTAAQEVDSSSTSNRARTPSPLGNRPRKAPPQPKSSKPAVIKAKPQTIPDSTLPGPSTPKKKTIPPATQDHIASPVSSKQIAKSPKTPPAVTHPKPSLPPVTPIAIPSKSPRLPAAQDNDSSSSVDSFVSASDRRSVDDEEEYKLSWRAELASQNRRLTNASTHTINSSATIGSLADAIVASSLASSRAGSPSKALQNATANSLSTFYPPLPPPRRSKHHHHPGHLFHNGKNDISRTPSPGKINGAGGVGNGGTGMLRTTMRKVKSKEEVDEGEKRRGRKNLVKKHPNKHHEGDRKRWRDSITERERKRYEAVWASNRGLYTSSQSNLSQGNPENEVCNLVVRDVFSRSRLSPEVLEEVYDLVDRRGLGVLGKEEFVVGLWLLDQRLKGRKLPIRVSESVWNSVGVMTGIKVRGVR